MKTAVYFCNCGSNIKDRVDAEKVALEAGALPGVEHFKAVDFLCSEEGREFLEKDLLENKPERVVIAACSPREHEGTFMRIMSKAGLNPYFMQMTNVREQVAWVTEDREKAAEKTVSYIRSAVLRAGLQEPLEIRHLDVRPEVLVIGAGPSGLKAALSIAESGRKVTLVEKAPVIGGMPVRYEEIFPDMECGPCMLEPMLDEVLHGEHAQDIELLTLSEVSEVLGFYGNFTAKIKRTPRHVDLSKCIGCAECVGACPVSAKNAFDYGLSVRKAISFPFLGALPNAPFLDMKVCLRGKGQDCTLCRDVCPVEGTIDYGEEAALIERNVGAVVVAVGSTVYDCGVFPGLRYGEFPEVYTSVEFERLLASNGPTGGEIKTASGETPRSLALIHCVGSLDKDHREYCSGICCQTAFKFNHVVEKKLPGAKIGHFYKELSFPGKTESALYRHARENPDASFIRYADIKDIDVSSIGGGLSVEYRDSSGAAGAFQADIVVLCPAVVPHEKSPALGALMELSTDRFGFFEELHGRTDSVKSRIKGVYISGSCQSPMNIREAVNQGMAAAGYILSGLVPGRKLEISPVTAEVDAQRCSGCRVCVPVCPYRAISFNEESEAAEINAVLCQGCGTCVSACPSAAIKGNHFTNEEIMAEIEGMLR